MNIICLLFRIIAYAISLYSNGFFIFLLVQLFIPLHSSQNFIVKIFLHLYEPLLHLSHRFGRFFTIGVFNFFPMVIILGLNLLQGLFATLGLNLCLAL